VRQLNVEISETVVISQETDLSIIVPVYNGEAFIQQTLDSILRQKIDNIEIIVVDDGSTDSTPKILSSYEERYPTTILITKNSRSDGVSGARNTGLALAKGRLIAFLDADDIVLPETLKFRVDTLLNSSHDILITDFALFDDDVQLQEELEGYCSSAFKRLGFGEVPYSEIEQQPIDFFLQYFCVMWMGSVMFKSFVLKNKHTFDEDLAYGEDEDLWYKVCLGNKIKYVNEVTTGYRKHDKSVTVDLIKKYQGACNLRRVQLKNNFLTNKQKLLLIRKFNQEFLQLAYYLRTEKHYGLLLKQITRLPIKFLVKKVVLKQLIAALFRF